MGLRDHHFTKALCPWPNGSVERSTLDILAVLHLLTSEMALPFQNWPYLPKFGDALVSAPSAVLGWPCPRPFFGGFWPAILSLQSYYHHSSRTYFPTVYKTAMDKLAASLANMHCKVSESRARRNGVRRKQPETLINLSEGDYVLHANRYRKNANKLVARWHGPYRLTQVANHWVYEIEDLLSGSKVRQRVRREHAGGNTKRRSGWAHRLIMSAQTSSSPGM